MKKKSPYREPGEPHIDPLPLRLRVRDSIRGRLQRIGAAIKGVYKAYSFWGNGWHALATIFFGVVPALFGGMFLAFYLSEVARHAENRAHRMYVAHKDQCWITDGNAERESVDMRESFNFKDRRINLPYNGTTVIATRSDVELTEALSREGIDATMSKDVVTPMIIENEEQAQEAMRALTRFYHTPVMPIDRYCEALRTWQQVQCERTARLKEAEFPGICGPYYGPDEAENARTRKAHADFVAAKKAYDENTVPLDAHGYAMSDIRSGEDMDDAVARTFQQITKSSLLNRLLYCGEKLRTQMCPEHKGMWSGLEWGPSNACPHRCQLTGWIQEPEDQGQPLLGPQDVTSVCGVAVGIQDVTGTVIGKART